MAQPAGHSNLIARASLFLIGLAWVLPFLQSRHSYPLTGFYSEWLAFALGLAAALVLLARQSWHEAELPLVALAPIALALVLGLHAVLGLVPYPEQAITAMLYLLWASLLMLLTRVLARQLGMASIVATLSWFLLAGGLLSALAGYAQTFHIPSVPDFLVTRKVSARAYGNLGQPNHYAVYLTMALCSIGYLYGTGRMRSWMAIACSASVLPALVLSGARGPWFYLVVIAVLAWAVSRKRVGPEAYRLLAYSLGLLPAFILVAFLITTWMVAAAPAFGIAAEPSTSGQRLFESAAGLTPRLELAGEAWKMFLSAPLLGAGWGQFAWHHFEAVASAGTTAAPGVYNHAHNIVLHFLAETGLAGGGLLTAAAILWIVDLKRVRLDFEWWWVLALIAVLGIHSMIEFPLWYSYFLGIAAVLLGLGSQRNFRMKRPGFSRLTVAVLLVAGCFNLVSVLHYYREFERLMFASDARKPVKLDEKEFMQSIARLYSEPMLTPYIDLAVTFGFVLDTKNLPEKLALADRALRFAPMSYLAYRRALLTALASEPEEAQRRFEQAARAYPQDLPEIRSELSRLTALRPEVFAPLLKLAINASTNASPSK